MLSQVEKASRYDAGIYCNCLDVGSIHLYTPILSLSRLEFHLVIEIRSRHPLQAGSDQAQTGGERKTKAALKRRGAQHPAVARLRADCEEHLGHYLMSRLRGEADMPEELQEACAIRHQWLLGRIAELRRSECPRAQNRRCMSDASLLSTIRGASC